MFVTGPRPFGARVPSRTMQLCSSSVTSRPPLRWYLRSARIASSRPVILRSTTSRWRAPSPSAYPTGRVNSNSRRGRGSVDTFQPLVLEDDRLLQQGRRARLQVGELGGLDPRVPEHEGQDALAVVPLLDHAVLPDLRPALLRRVEVEDLLEPFVEALVLRASVDVALDRERFILHLRRRDLVD